MTEQDSPSARRDGTSGFRRFARKYLIPTKAGWVCAGIALLIFIALCAHVSP